MNAGIRLAPLLAAVVVSFLAGCASAAAESDDASEAEVRRRLACPIRQQNGCRVVQAGDVKTLFASEGILMPGATFTLPDGSFAAFAPRYEQAVALRVRSTDLVRFTSPEVVAGNVADMTGARGRAGTFLYFAGATGLYRSTVDAVGQLAQPVPVNIQGVPIVPYWPQATGLRDGRVLLAFVEQQTRAFLAESRDGVTFEQRPTPVPAGVRRGILAHVGETKRGAWVFTHQIADASWSFTSLVHLSRDQGSSWSEAIVVAPNATDVHDAYPITRTDEGADLYYLHVGDAGVFSVFRRALLEDGTLGPEQAVTGPEIGHVEKPQARRLPDGRIALSFAVRKTNGAYDVRLAVLDADAPRR
jgi:hypothetical protein